MEAPDRWGIILPAPAATRAEHAVHHAVPLVRHPGRRGHAVSTSCGDKLLAGGGSPTQCGWLKDRFGLSWQIIPAVLPRLLGDPDRGKAARAMQAMLTMVKIDGAALQRAFDGV